MIGEQKWVVVIKTTICNSPMGMSTRLVVSRQSPGNIEIGIDNNLYRTGDMLCLDFEDPRFPDWAYIETWKHEKDTEEFNFATNDVYFINYTEEAKKGWFREAHDFEVFSIEFNLL